MNSRKDMVLCFVKATPTRRRSTTTDCLLVFVQYDAVLCWTRLYCKKTVIHYIVCYTIGRLGLVGIWGFSMIL